MRATYDIGQQCTSLDVKARVQIVDISEQNLFDETALRELHSEQWVHELILFIIDQIQPDLWQEIAVCHADIVIQEGVLSGEVVDRYGTVHWMAV